MNHVVCLERLSNQGSIISLITSHRNPFFLIKRQKLTLGKELNLLFNIPYLLIFFKWGRFHICVNLHWEILYNKHIVKKNSQMKFLFVIALFIYMRSSNTFNDTNLKLWDREDTIPTNKCHVFLNSMENKNKIMFFFEIAWIAAHLIHRSNEIYFSINILIRFLHGIEEPSEMCLTLKMWLHSSVSCSTQLVSGRHRFKSCPSLNLASSLQFPKLQLT